MRAGEMHWISEFLTMGGFVLLTVTFFVSLALVVLLEEDEYKHKWAPQFVYTYYFELLKNPGEYLTEQGIKLFRLQRRFLVWGAAGTVILFVLGSVETIYAGLQS
ncbi:MAG: hypothetical protein ACO3MW_11840 [Rhodospirillales bacterium]|jgi:hypothetical protein